MTFEERSKQFEEEFIKLKEKYQLELNTDINFPVYNILPPEVQLALQVLINHKMEIRIVYKDKAEVVNK